MTKRSFESDADVFGHHSLPKSCQSLNWMWIWRANHVIPFHVTQFSDTNILHTRTAKIKRTLASGVHHSPPLSLIYWNALSMSPPSQPSLPYLREQSTSCCSLSDTNSPLDLKCWPSRDPVWNKTNKSYKWWGTVGGHFQGVITNKITKCWVVLYRQILVANFP